MNLEDWYRMTERPEERELRRKIRRAAIMEWIGLAVLIPLSILLFWLFVIATPDQPSAINDLDAAAEAARSDMGEGANREAARPDTEAR